MKKIFYLTNLLLEVTMKKYLDKNKERDQVCSHQDTKLKNIKEIKLDLKLYFI